ncbi:unnamed protein product [Leptosia nina]|uniref:Dual specificity protein phosphatase 19 n=1 Tax=Leptosia nina TaxID=320188 RepID=A0AAV1JUU0_9NEOP
MSFIDKIKQQRNKLRGTTTVITNVDGKRFLVTNAETKQIGENRYGFVVDTDPDDTPALILEHLYIGSQDCAIDNILHTHNIKHVLSLGVDVNVSVNNKKLDILDLPDSNVVPVLKESLPFLKEAIKRKENVLVHCNAGVSRTSLVAIGYLMQYEGMSYEEAHALVKSKRPAIRPNDGFIKQLRCVIPGAFL